MDISWIVSMFGFLDCFVAAPFGVIFDRYGSKILLPLGSMVYLASFVGLAFASTYGQFMACFVVAGLSAGNHSYTLSLPRSEKELTGVTSCVFSRAHNSCIQRGQPLVLRPTRTRNRDRHRRCCSGWHLLLPGPSGPLPIVYLKGFHPSTICHYFRPRGCRECADRYQPGQKRGSNRGSSGLDRLL